MIFVFIYIFSILQNYCCYLWLILKSILKSVLHVFLHYFKIIIN